MSLEWLRHKKELRQSENLELMHPGYKQMLIRDKQNRGLQLSGHSIKILLLLLLWSLPEYIFSLLRVSKPNFYTPYQWTAANRYAFLLSMDNHLPFGF